MPYPTGYVIYRGPSEIDGEPIVVVMTIGSKNSKTGDLAQTWILREDVSPVEASAYGLDSSICGACPHRHSLGGACYVQIFQAPRSVYAAYMRGAYPAVDLAELSGALRLSGVDVRAGSYGDPGAVPGWVWDALPVKTGYTHQWRVASLQSTHMASVDSPAEKIEANGRGYRTFRVRPAGAPLMTDEIDCPSKRGVSCADCGLCGGMQRRAKNISIEGHGARASTRLKVIA